MMAAINGVPITVAIVGGGMAGLCLAIALTKLPHVHVQIYEAANQFSEIGVGVSFGPNAVRALQLIGADMEQALFRIATYNTWEELKNVWLEYRWGMGPHEGELLASSENEFGQISVHRAKFLEELVKMVPPEIANFGKRLEKLDSDTDGVTLHFSDGTAAKADCVVGADGVHSIVRPWILGQDHPAVKPQFSGSVAYRRLVPMSEGVAAVGERYAQNAQVWVGHGAYILTYPIDGGKVMNMVAVTCSHSEWIGPWVQPVDHQKILQEFQGFGEHVMKLIQLLDRPGTMMWSLWDHPKTPTYFRGPVVMMGDAAHATTPYQGQGAAQAIEDAFVLSGLFAETHSSTHIAMAFQAFDQIRRPRAGKICETSREAGHLAALRLPGVLDDPLAFKEHAEWRMDWIWNRDIALEREQALGIFHKLVSAN